MVKICERFDINYLSIDKFITILKSKAQAKYDFANKPTILTHITGQTGHVGILVRTSGVKKIWAQDFLDYICDKEGPEMKVVEAQVLEKKTRAAEKMKAIQQQREKDQKSLEQAAFFYQLRKAAKKFDKLPVLVQDSSLFACAIYSASRTAGMTAPYPTSFTSQRAVLYAAGTHKSQFPFLFAVVSEEIKEVKKYSTIKFGSIPLVNTIDDYFFDVKSVIYITMCATMCVSIFMWSKMTLKMIWDNIRLYSMMVASFLLAAYGFYGFDSHIVARSYQC